MSVAFLTVDNKETSNNNLLYVFNCFSTDWTLELVVFANSLICCASPTTFRAKYRVRISHFG